MKTKSRLNKTFSFFLALTLCVPMLLALAAPASASSGRAMYNISYTACSANLSAAALPAGISQASAGQQLYINVAATSDIRLKTIEAYVSVNGGEYTLAGRETATSYMRWASFGYLPAASGSLTVLVRIYYTNGKSAQSAKTISIAGDDNSKGDSITWNGTRYTVVPHADAASYHYNQNSYRRFVNSRGRNVGCTATAMACAYSIRHNTALSPNSVRWSSAGCSWEYATRLDSYSPYSYSAQDALQAVYRSINSGIPVIVGVTGAGIDHVVAVIGYRQGASPYGLSLSDILIIDPNGGQVCSLAKYSGIDTGWSLRIPI